MATVEIVKGSEVPLWKLRVARYLRAQRLIDRACYPSDGFRCACDVDEEKLIVRESRAKENLGFTKEEWDSINSFKPVPILEEF